MNAGNICELFLSSEDMNKFSGYALYTQYGIPVRLNRYVSGLKVAGISSIGIMDKETKEGRLKSILKKLKEFKFVKKQMISMTRMGEDDEWDYGSGEDDWWYQNGDFFIDDYGNIFVDSDGDGDPDSGWIPDVDVTPDNETDPDPNNGTDSDYNMYEDEDQEHANDQGYEEGEYADDTVSTNNNSDNTDDTNEMTDEECIILGNKAISKMDQDIKNGNFVGKRITLNELGQASLTAVGTGLNGFGLTSSLSGFFPTTEQLTMFGRRLGCAGVAVGLAQTVVAFTDGDISNADIVNGISVVIGGASVACTFIPVLMPCAPVVGAVGCFVGLVATCMSTDLPTMMEIQLENGINI